MNNVHERDSEKLAWMMSIEGEWEIQVTRSQSNLKPKAGYLFDLIKERFIIDNLIASRRTLRG